MRLHIGRSDIAHQVAWVPWSNDLTLPGPACHQGWFRARRRRRYHPHPPAGQLP
jgi:hypothetical protein